MQVVTSKEMEQIELASVSQLGISIYDLMEKAGKAVADAVIQKFTDVKNKQIVIVSGKGNNGGDGFVAGRILAKSKAKVNFFLLSSQDELKGEAALAFNSLGDLSSKCQVLTPENFESFKNKVSQADIIIDAIFGFGFKGAVKDFIADVIDVTNDSNAFLVSVDIPSGVEADSGHIHSVCVRADETITFGLSKIGLLLYPGAEHTGKLTVADIGFPPEAISSVDIKAEVIEGKDIKRILPERPPDIHKKKCGQVLVIAGSIGMTGAAVLTAESALRSGAGIVMLGVPKSLNSIFEQKLTEVMTIPLDETFNHALGIEAFDQIVELSGSFDVVVIGPGLSLDPSTVLLVRRLIKEINLPIVLDADGLNAMVGEEKKFAKRLAPTIITPHPGELSRLLKTTSDEIQQDRITFVKQAAKEWNVVVVLKGAHTIIGSPDGEIKINITGNSGMATAGTGDVLTGLIGGFLAQKLSPLNASVLGTYLHGLAGDIGVEKTTEYCLVASDLIKYLPKAIKAVRRKNWVMGDR
ncbi:MAG: NAD(P)H-hydrate dehydratase [Actinobacteria bacterium]|nr:NAD(P)H-hydrate dehydratase [Actinomycetota bacterium]